MRISDWSSEVCSSVLLLGQVIDDIIIEEAHLFAVRDLTRLGVRANIEADDRRVGRGGKRHVAFGDRPGARMEHADTNLVGRQLVERIDDRFDRSEEHTSELQSLMRISYAVFCLKKTKTKPNQYKQIAYE